MTRSFASQKSMRDSPLSFLMPMFRRLMWLFAVPTLAFKAPITILMSRLGIASGTGAVRVLLLAQESPGVQFTLIPTIDSKNRGSKVKQV